MNRASPVDIRKSLEMANEIAGIGISFVPIPVTSEADRAHLMSVFFKRLEIIEKSCAEDSQ